MSELAKLTIRRPPDDEVLDDLYTFYIDGNVEFAQRIYRPETGMVVEHREWLDAFGVENLQREVIEKLDPQPTD
jgi:hypothetical protein